VGNLGYARLAFDNRLWKWLASSSPIDGTALGQLSGKQFSPFMEMVYYRLWKWYITVYGNGILPFMEMVSNRFKQPL
jgi:hypothetical protein